MYHCIQGDVTSRNEYVTHVGACVHDFKDIAVSINICSLVPTLQQRRKSVEGAWEQMLT